DRFVFQSAGNPVMAVHLGFGRVGIGSISPQNKLDVIVDTTSSSVVRAVYGSAVNNSSFDPIGAIGGYFSGTRSGGEGYGVYGTGGRYGVFGTGYGGVRGEGSYGVSGEGTNTGVDGRGASVGVLGLATNNNGYGVYGSNSGNPLTFAGYFSGDVYVNGNLGKAGGGFKIDHPLDPADKYLQHSFVESPDMKNIYDGVITTDAKGNATVTLPEWFGALNRDFRYQLTVIGEFAQAIISKEIYNNQFSIQTNKPKVKVSWQVTGIRQDAWANAHRLSVEQAKTGNERGTYISPELFGQPEERNVNWANHPELMKAMKAKKMQAEQK
ncbi:MAG TPA: hypothetical protein VFR89_00910, partial [candidate division Zixibacteria bacterium]|nr:hypothetical protein [candidate division Zixibacteria bacterium]